MNFTHLRAFVAVAGESGFTRGAARLGVSQPAVTVQVRALEQRYGVELFRRLGQRVELTELGRDLFERARPLFARLDDLDDLLVSAGALTVGRLTIGADGPFSVMALVATFMARHPGIRVAVQIGNAQRVLADLEQARTDAAVLNLTGPSDHLPRQVLGRDRLIAFVRHDHPWSALATVELAALADEPLVLRETGSATRGLLLDALATAGLQPRVALELGSREAVREAVLAGLGVGVVFAKELAGDPRLCPVEIRASGLDASVSLACLPERRELRAVQALFAVAAALAGGTGGCRAGGSDGS